MPITCSADINYRESPKTPKNRPHKTARPPKLGGSDFERLARIPGRAGQPTGTFCNLISIPNLPPVFAKNFAEVLRRWTFQIRRKPGELYTSPTTRMFRKHTLPPSRRRGRAVFKWLRARYLHAPRGTLTRSSQTHYCWESSGSSACLEQR